MVGTRHSIVRDQLVRERAQPTLHAVADHGVADFLGDGDPESHLRFVILARADLQDETGHGDSLAAVGGQEISPFSEND
jgi:hypothetical protein